MNRISRYLWLIIIVLFILIWINKGDIYRFIRPKPNPESLGFNRANTSHENEPMIVSSDEKINIEVFEKVHPAVVNIAATTLRRNFWLDIIPQEGQGTGFIIDRRGFSSLFQFNSS